MLRQLLAVQVLTVSFLVQAKIYQTVDRRTSSTKQNIPVRRPADSNNHTSRSLTCTVTTRSQSTTSSLATFARLTTWSRRHGSQDLRRAEGSRSSSVGARGFVELLAADDALHRNVMSQSSCLRTYLGLNPNRNRPTILSLCRPSKKSETRNHDDGVCSPYYVNEVRAHRFLSFIA